MIPLRLTDITSPEDVTGLSWLSTEDACDLLRVPQENAGAIGQLVESIPLYVEDVTGFPAYLTASELCDPTVKQLCRFLLQLWFNPDGEDAAKLSRVVTSLTRTVRALAIYYDLDEPIVEVIDGGTGETRPV